MQIEHQVLEWKSTWKDDHLREICAFANAQGGILCIGKDDHGRVTGVPESAARKLLENLPNKVRDVTGVQVDVNLHAEGSLYWLEVVVPAVSTPVSCRGEFYYRSGSVCQQLTGPALTYFLLEKTGAQWDSIPVDRVAPEELDSISFEIFQREALRNRRMSAEDFDISRRELLQRLELLDEQGRLKRAALLLFHPHPTRWFAGAFIKVGFFQNDAEILYDDTLEGSLFRQADQVIDLIYTKYMRAWISYDGITRVDRYPFPRTAIREAVFNAIIHSDYSSGVPIQIRVYDQKVVIYNQARIPMLWVQEGALDKHGSKAINPLIARAFYRAGHVESWGRGIKRIADACREYGTAPQSYRFTDSEVVTVFEYVESEPYTVENSEAPPAVAVKLTERQTTILHIIDKHPFFSLSEIATSACASASTVNRELTILRKMGMIQRRGSRKNGVWEVIKHTAQIKL
ncbi:MAG: putative DNA binding domain-containing protein [Akkermansia sp.]|nr:putative DNA binding domain-containing protein [Akkermansia sp.]